MKEQIETRTRIWLLRIKKQTYIDLFITHASRWRTYAYLLSRKLERHCVTLQHFTYAWWILDFPQLNETLVSCRNNEARRIETRKEKESRKESNPVVLYTMQRFTSASLYSCTNRDTSKLLRTTVVVGYLDTYILTACGRNGQAVFFLSFFFPRSLVKPLGVVGVCDTYTYTWPCSICICIYIHSTVWFVSKCNDKHPAQLASSSLVIPPCSLFRLSAWSTLKITPLKLQVLCVQFHSFNNEKSNFPKGSGTCCRNETKREK